MDDLRLRHELRRARECAFRLSEHSCAHVECRVGKALSHDGPCRLSEPSVPAPPATVDLFHGTASGLLAGIFEKGLVPGGGAGSDLWAIKYRRYAIVDASADKRPASVYLVRQPTLTHCYAEHAAEMNPGSSALIIHLKLPAAVAATLKLDELDDDAHRFEGVIKAEWIASINRLAVT